MPEWFGWYVIAVAVFNLAAAIVWRRQALRTQRKLTAARVALQEAERERDQVLRLLPDPPPQQPPPRPPERP